MGKKETQNRGHTVKVGVFFLGALIIFFVAILSIKEVSFFEGKYPLRIKFHFVEGLKPASPVRFCGVDVGEIKSLEIKEENKTPTVYVNVKVANNVKLPKGSTFFVNSLSVFGEKYLEIVPPQEGYNGYIQKGAVIVGVDSTPLFKIINSAGEALKKVDSFFAETGLQNSIVETVENIGGAAGELEGLIKDIKKKEGTIGKFFYDDSIYIKTEEFVDDIKAHPWKLLYRPKTKRK